MNIIKKLKNKLQAFGSAVFLFYLCFPLGVSWAQEDVGDMFNNLDINASRVPKVITYGSYSLGILMTIAGLVKIREYVEDPDRNTFRTALIRLAVGAGFIIAPWVMENVLGTIGADGRDFTSRSGPDLYSDGY